MAEKFVAKTGNDSNDGSEGSPFLTIDKGISVLNGSDILTIDAGNYIEAIRFSTRAIPSGVNGAPTIIRAKAGAAVQLTPNSGTYVIVTDAIRNWIEFRGLYQGNGASLICSAGSVDHNAVVRATDGCSDITFDGLEITDSGVSHGFISSDDCGPRIKLLNSRIHNNGNSFTSGSVPHGVYIQSDDALVQGNEIWNNTKGYGVHQFNNGQRLNVNTNYIHDNESGILLGFGDDHLAYNNLIEGGGLGIDLGTGSVAQDGIMILCNSIWGTGSAIYSDDSGNQTNFIIRGNIAYPLNAGGDGSIFLNNSNQSGWIVTHNLVREDFSIAGSGHTKNNIVIGDPLLIDPANGNFRLQDGSPAINVGIDLSALMPAVDYAGNIRSGLWDIGAFNFGGRANSGARSSASGRNIATGRGLASNRRII